MDVMIEPRPDTAVVIREPSKYVSEPGKSNLVPALRVFRYLQFSTDHHLEVSIFHSRFCLVSSALESFSDEDTERYQRIMECLMDCMIRTRPDTAVVIREPSKYVSKPDKSIVVAVKGFEDTINLPNCIM